MTAVAVVLRFCKGTIDRLAVVLTKQLEIVDKATTIAASHDLAVYQGVQAMGSSLVGYDGETYDPSDEAEFRREAERNHLDPEELSDAEQEQLTSLF